MQRILNYSEDALLEVIDVVKQHTERSMCSWQAAVTVCCNERQDNIIVTAPCGAGKTLAFIGTLFCRPNDIIVLVCPLLSLSSQHCTDLKRYGVDAIEIAERTLCDKALFEVSFPPSSPSTTHSAI